MGETDLSRSAGVRAEEVGRPGDLAEEVGDLGGAHKPRPGDFGGAFRKVVVVFTFLLPIDPMLDREDGRVVAVFKFLLPIDPILERDDGRLLKLVLVFTEVQDLFVDVV